MPNASVLIIDDEDKLRGLLKRIITLEGYTVLEASTLKQSQKLLEREAVDVILCDVKLPDGNGVDFVQQVKLQFPLIETILLTAYGNIPDGVQAMKNGAFDYITKGDDNDKIIPLLARATEKAQLHKRIRQLEKQVGRKYSFDTILGNSSSIKHAIAMAQKVSATDATVLLMGETGSGKEVFAQAIHYNSGRTNGNFVAVNCSAFTKDLLESEIFGHKAGAFTGAVKDKKGLIEEADNGTLFLDEMGEMPLELQAKLLRVLENNEYIKVGDTKTLKANVRIIAATNRNLEEEVSKGHFREDLFYRLNVFTITLPSLNDRREDIPLFAAFYVKMFSEKLGKNIKGVDKEALQLLKNHNWKGNIRELKNIIERACILSDGHELIVSDLPIDFQAVHEVKFLSAFDLAAVEKLHIQRVLNHTGGNKTEAARLMNIGLTTLYRKIEEYGLR